ncbi:uncharacterized protein LOC110630340 [Manihot esculenta]|uniref:Uncharacterized protein n=1 Tax=Manihot esculenta TaxID=3983 RepID=A0A2C9UQB2_MANES|nr:uncharacterized protein LOC110630340 [Manihot esculenta]OAY33348.1 hypothetical protein MANES_13G088400v8 [Manihot esculenta]
MADIAIMVAEEYERRIKDSRKVSADSDMKVGNWISFLSQSVNNKVRLQNIEDVKWVFQPKTQVALAASNGLFSA